MTSVPDPTPDAVGEPQRRPVLTPRELEILRLWLRSESKNVAAATWESAWARSTPT